MPPIPLWMYVYGGAATLVVTFAGVGIFVSAPASAANIEARAARFEPPIIRVREGTLAVLRAGALCALLLTILAGLVGNQDPAHNLGMTLFWVTFLLAFSYCSLIVGDLYRLINPWRCVINMLECIGPDLSKARFAYPPRLAHWPSFALYAALIWIELFVAPTPKVLAAALLIYSCITFLGVVLFGKVIWFERADPLAVFFRLIGVLAPIEYRPASNGESWHVYLRAPFAGALSERPGHLSLVLFMLLVLASTSYDAIHETTLWVGLYWKNLLWLLQPLWGEDLAKAQDSLMDGYLIYRQVGLIVFPFLYLALYGFAIWTARVLTRTSVPTRTLTLNFSYSLLPIAIAYHFTHYFPFLMAEWSNLPGRLSDPLGFGWNVLGLESGSEASPLPMGVIWHTQVAVLILGHIVSVYLAHRIATRTFATQRQAIVSQLPLLVLMVGYTIFGLWILSLPLAE